MSAQEDLATLQSNNAADATALTSLEAELNTPAVPSVGDQVLDAILPVLTAAGYTVTPPVPASDASTESSTQNATDSSTEV